MRLNGCTTGKDAGIGLQQEEKMILADKIIEERKKLGWNQEELAEHLEVSRQSVSKWESAQSIPDINRILQLAQLFGVSTDYLLKDDAVRESMPEAEETVSGGSRSVRPVSMEEASAYLGLKKKQAPILAFGVALCVSCAVPLLLLLAASAGSGSGLSENTAGVAGVAILLMMVSAAVYLFVRCGHDAEKYEYLEKVEIETAYGIDGMAKEKRADYEVKYTRSVAVGVVLCILCPVPLILSSLLTESETMETAMIGVLLLLVAAAVYLFVSAGTIKGSYDVLLQEGDYTVVKKKNAPVMHRVATIYWLVAVALYLAISLTGNSWDRSWVLWPVAGVLFGVIVIITKMMLGENE